MELPIEFISFVFLFFIFGVHPITKQLLLRLGKIEIMMRVITNDGIFRNHLKSWCASQGRKTSGENRYSGT
jgi:hypothetical protein